jgi:hypothetical protein
MPFCRCLSLRDDDDGPWRARPQLYWFSLFVRISMAQRAREQRRQNKKKKPTEADEDAAEEEPAAA